MRSTSSSQATSGNLLPTFKIEPTYLGIKLKLLRLRLERQGSVGANGVVILQVWMSDVG
jgi:hypothetical protein